MNKLITDLYTDHVQRGKEWIEVAKEYYETNLLIAQYTKKKEMLMDTLKELSEHKNAIGGGFILTGIERSGTVDYKSIPQLQEIDLDLYRKSSVISWSVKRV